MKKSVIHLLRRSLILLVILFALDRLIGAGLERMYYKQKHGDDQVTLYTLDSTKEDLLVFGSSRASHHYNVEEMERELGVSAYNCGRDEMGVSYTAAMLPLVMNRYKPKYVLIEVLPTELATWGKDVSERHIATVLMPLAYRHPSLWQTIAYADKYEVYKAAVSRIYPYNSMIAAFVQNTYTHFGHSSDRGYEPLYKSIDTNVYSRPIWKSFDHAVNVDTSLQRRFTGLLDFAASQGVQVYVMISPFYFYQDLSGNKSFQGLKELTAAHGAHLMDFSYDPRFVKHPSLFNDDVHLNDTGARLYTRIVADSLRSLGLGQNPLSFRE
jgi:hypothetical protein